MKNGVLASIWSVRSGTSGKPPTLPLNGELNPFHHRWPPIAVAASQHEKFVISIERRGGSTKKRIF
jgi:hypothetical protein